MIDDKTLDRFLAGASVMTDEYMTFFFANQNGCAQVLIRAILGQDDLVVEKVDVQRHIRNIRQRESVLDVLAKDAEGNYYNIEIQNDTGGADVKRARYHSSQMDSVLLGKGEHWNRLPETYTIFITWKDLFKDKKMVYHFVRQEIATGHSMDDGTHIIYGILDNIDIETKVGRVLKDLTCTKVEDIVTPEFAERTRYIKLNPEGRKAMNAVLQECIEAGRQEGIGIGRQDEKKRLASNLLKEGMPLVKIAALCEMTQEELAKLLNLS